MSSNLRKKISFLILLLLFFTSVSFINLCNAEAVAQNQNTSSVAGKATSTKSANSKNNSTNTKSNSKTSSNSSQSESLLSGGDSLPPATSQNWDQIMSDINNNTDKDEFTFSKEPSHLGFFGSKLSYIGFGLILLSILGFTYFLFSAFFGKKSTRKLKKLSANNNLNKNYYPINQTKTRKNIQNKKSIYSDGYGYTRNPQQARPAKKAQTSNVNKNLSANTQKPKVKSNNANLKSSTNSMPKAKHMLDDDDSNILMSNDNSIKNISSKHSKAKNTSKKNNKKDEFWNDFFLN